MTVERRDIEEVGEAVEALGIMWEEALGGIHERLAGLQDMIIQIKTEGQSFKEELLELKDKITKAGETFKGLESVVARTESRLLDMQKNISDEEDFSEDIKSDLLVIKRDLQFIRSDMKELVERNNFSDDKT
jgi:chromosome segregation ATPase